MKKALAFLFVFILTLTATACAETDIANFLGGSISDWCDEFPALTEVEEDLWALDSAFELLAEDGSVFEIEMEDTTGSYTLFHVYPGMKKEDALNALKQDSRIAELYEDEDGFECDLNAPFGNYMLIGIYEDGKLLDTSCINMNFEEQ